MLNTRPLLSSVARTVARTTLAARGTSKCLAPLANQSLTFGNQRVLSTHPTRVALQEVADVTAETSRHDTAAGEQARAFKEAGSVENQKTSLIFSISDEPGSLATALKTLEEHGVSMSHIESRPSKGTEKTFDFSVDLTLPPEHPKVDDAIRHLRKRTEGVLIVDPISVPFFPTRISDIDDFTNETLDAGEELQSDHPGFNDPEYRERRAMITDLAQKYKHGEEIPRVTYTDKEVETWKVVYDKVKDYTSKYGVDEYNQVMPQLEKHCGYAPNNIPQLQDISEFLNSTTGFTLRPVGGLLSARDFLNGLAFRVFFSTQYIRHHSTPLYTPEPDICHELLGHAPMFADPDFADFSHEIGLASLGASDEEIKKLATCYWFSVEFGLCQQQGQRKAYGAGLLSSFGELEYSCAPYRPAGGVEHWPEYRQWDPTDAANQDYPITTYQPVYYVADSLSDAKKRMRDYCNALPRPFNVKFDPYTKSVTVDRNVVRQEYKVTKQS